MILLCTVQFQNVTATVFILGILLYKYAIQVEHFSKVNFTDPRY